jgi:hypothetical protein
MPGNAGKFTQLAHAWLRAGHDEAADKFRHDYCD